MMAWSTVGRMRGWGMTSGVGVVLAGGVRAVGTGSIILLLVRLYR
jgi:hypothetical protein